MKAFLVKSPLGRKKDNNLFPLPLVTVSNWEKGVMVVERNDIWLRKQAYVIYKHLEKQVITDVLLV